MLKMPPVDAILDQANLFDATIIAMGWRGHGTVQRLLAGSVSRAVAARAKCSVLIVREAPRTVSRILLGHDGSANGDRAVDFLCSVEPARSDAQVLVVDVVEPLPMPASAGLLPQSTRARLKHELLEFNASQDRDAARAVEGAVRRLSACGWKAMGETPSGEPLSALLAMSEKFRPNVLALGARGVSGLQRALLGSVANGALNRSSVPVLLAR
jgi:nucleotide-binding universal stress UspA family protein